MFAPESATRDLGHCHTLYTNIPYACMHIPHAGVRLVITIVHFSVFQFRHTCTLAHTYTHTHRNALTSSGVCARKLYCNLGGGVIASTVARRRLYTTTLTPFCQHVASCGAHTALTRITRNSSLFRAKSINCICTLSARYATHICDVLARGWGASARCGRRMQFKVRARTDKRDTSARALQPQRRNHCPEIDWKRCSIEYAVQCAGRQRNISSVFLHSTCRKLLRSHPQHRDICTSHTSSTYSLTCDFPFAHATPQRLGLAQRPVLDLRGEAAYELELLQCGGHSASHRDSNDDNDVE